MIINEQITRDRLSKYVDLCKTLVLLQKKKSNLEKKLGLKGVNYSTTKVMSGTKKSSEEERYVLLLERVNTEIKQIREQIEPEHQIIIEQIRRLKTSRSRTIITLRYIEGRSTQDLVEYFFADDILFNPNNNIDDFKKTTDYENFRRTYQRWQQDAVEELERISGVPFAPKNQVYEQLYLQA